MVVGAFPLFKLGFVALRQIARPLANLLKRRAKSSPFFRNYICIPPAQLYHTFETRIRLRSLGLGTPKEVRPMDEVAAIELGADMVGETVIFAVSALVVYLEYRRQARNTARHEKSQSDTLAALVQQVELLHLRLARLELAQGLPPGPAPPPLPLPSDESSESASTSSTSSAHASSSSNHTTNGSGSGDVKTQGTNSGKVASATKSAATPTAQNDAPSSAASSVKPSTTATVNKK